MRARRLPHQRAGWALGTETAFVRLLIALASALMLTGCASYIDTDQQRLCRSLLPAIDRVATKFSIDQVIETTSGPSASIAVDISYRGWVDDNDRTSTARSALKRQTLRCEFASASGRAQPVLIRVVANNRELGPLRLRVLQRAWIDSGAAAVADPAPISMMTAAPSLPRTIAIGLQQILGSLPVIAVYALLATAYALIYGLVGRINLAFGDLSSLAGYGAFLGFSMIGDGHVSSAVMLAVVVGLFTAALHGGTLGRYVVARLAKGPGQHILIATIGMSIFWQEAMRLTQGAGNRWLSPLMNRPVGIARSGDFIVTITPMALIVAAIAGIAAMTLVFALRRSRFGMSWRATADDPIAAALMGIDTTAVLVRTMVLAALLSGLGGVLTTFYYGGVGYAGGLIIGLKALIAAIVGGIGSVHGALLGGLLLGLAETVWSSLFPIEYRDPAIFVGLAFVLWLKPEGFFGEPITRKLER